MIIPIHRATEPRGRRVATLLFFLTVSVISTGAGLESPFERNYRRIEGMSASERMRLERNFRQFRDMAETERNTYRRLHREIEEDTLKGGKLRDVLDGYNAWLATLSPFQRQEILAEKDPSERVKVVRRIRRDTINQPSAPTGQRPGPLSRLMRVGGMLAQLADSMQLSPREFDNVTGILEEQLSLRKEESSRLHAMPPSKRHLTVLKNTLEKIPDETPPNPGRPWPDDELMDKLLAAIDNKLVTDRLKTLPRSKRPPKSVGISGCPGTSGRMAARNRALRPSDDEMWSLLQDMDPKRREEILHLPPEEIKHRLELDSLAKRSPELRDLHFVLQRLVSRLDRPAMGRPRFHPLDGRPGPGPRRFPPEGRPGPPDGRRQDSPGRRQPGPPDVPPPGQPENRP